MNSNRKFMIACMSILAVGLGFVLYTTDPYGPRVFAFEWSPEEQEMVNGTLRMWISFQWTNQSLNIIAKINDINYDYNSRLGLQFDKNGNGKLDYTYEGYIFYPLNYWAPGGLDPMGRMGTCSVPTKNPYHTCEFGEDVGYTYNISIPKSELSKVKANVVHIYYLSEAVWEYAEKYWVCARAEGWQ